MNSKKSVRKSDNGQFWKALAFSVASLIILFCLAYTIIHGLGFTAENHSSELQSSFEQLAIALSFLTIILLVYLLAKYWEVYFFTQSSFTLGLLVMVWCLLLNAMLMNPMFVRMAGFLPQEGAFVFLPLLFELLTALTLIYLANK